MQIRVDLNGTGENPYARWGLSQNPFPQIASAETDMHLRHLAKLGAEPIPDADYIRHHLKGWSQEFIDLCIRQYRQGEYVSFNVEIRQ